MSKCILVVEDQADNRRILRDLLVNAGYELIEAESGEEAITAVTARRPDLILMDIQLPVIDGYEATRRIRTNPELKSVPIIAVTSYALAGQGSGRGLHCLHYKAVQPAGAACEGAGALSACRVSEAASGSTVRQMCRGE
jgi:two-component system cell cycle response regulator DivK